MKVTIVDTKSQDKQNVFFRAMYLICDGTDVATSCRCETAEEAKEYAVGYAKDVISILKFEEE